MRPATYERIYNNKMVNNFTLRQVGVLSRGVFVAEAAATIAEAIEGETLNML